MSPTSKYWKSGQIVGNRVEVEFPYLLLLRRYTSGAELISSSVAAGSSTQNQVLAAPVVGTEVPWAMTPDTANTYAAGAVVTASK
ncbi:hypothetical protein DPMN_019897 [Dreissena polymorpha]|uniref:Uncharacterized protein n=1 Tax=Dreissena polymorpha TaxID=45954 RepID=A0A9D4NFT8_DREPO|nr:hypothetical protein DPMN_007614 [Dreissena polymorpha]KAH3895732.1 hypothetical protein DPMN_019897 [Dreissena polymorpha]